MQELLVDFITSLDGYGAAEGWPGWGVLPSVEQPQSAEPREANHRASARTTEVSTWRSGIDQYRRWNLVVSVMGPASSFTRDQATSAADLIVSQGT